MPFLFASNILYSSGGAPPTPPDPEDPEIGSVSVTNQAVTQSGILPTQIAGYRVNTSGIVEARNRNSYSTRETWLLTGASSDFVAYVTYTGDVPTGTLSSEVNLSTSPEWSVNGDSGEKVTVLTVEIRNASTHAVLDSCTVELTAEKIGV